MPSDMTYKEWSNKINKIHIDNGQYRLRLDDNVQKIERNTSKIAFKKVVGDNNFYISTNSNITSSGYKYIKETFYKSMEMLNIKSNDLKNMKIIICPETEIGKNAIATYSASRNAILIYDKFNNNNYAKFQEQFTQPNNKYSTFIHELYHFLDAKAYEKEFGKITSNNYSQYETYIRDKSKKELDKIGTIDYNNISKYANESFKIEDYDEVYTEYRTYMKLRKK